MPSLAILAAFGIVSLKHSEENVLDTYAIVVYTLAIGAVWFYFYAWTQGEPEKMAYSLTRLAPNITEHGTSGILLILALVMTVAWLALPSSHLYLARSSFERSRPYCRLGYCHESLCQPD